MLDDKLYVLKQIEERDVHFIRFWFTDVLGNLKSIAVTSSEIEDSFEEGMGFDGSAIDGFVSVQESDMIALPLPKTFQVLPWRPKKDGVARMFCQILNPDMTPFEGDSRNILTKVVDNARSEGYIFNVGAEMEYFYFQDSSSPQALDNAGYFDLTSNDSASNLRRDTILTLEHMSIPVEYSYHGIAPSQQEIDLRFADAISMADAVMTFKMVVKEVALAHGVYATFMPKPMSDQVGSSMHVHQSLFNDNGENVFHDSNDPSGLNLSETAKHYIAGILHYAPEYTLITNQYVNSYKRLVTGYEAPADIAWGRSNRSAMVRIPAYKPKKDIATRIELRSPDSACNPYLAFAVTLGAGLRGIEEKLKLPDPVDDLNLFELTEAEKIARGIKSLPKTQLESVELFAASDLMKEILGEHVHSFIVKNKMDEVKTYLTQVSQWEVNNYLARL